MLKKKKKMTIQILTLYSNRLQYKQINVFQNKSIHLKQMIYIIMKRKTKYVQEYIYYKMLARFLDFISVLMNVEEKKKQDS